MRKDERERERERDDNRWRMLHILVGVLFGWLAAVWVVNPTPLPFGLFAIVAAGLIVGILVCIILLFQ